MVQVTTFLTRADIRENYFIGKKFLKLILKLPIDKVNIFVN